MSTKTILHYITLLFIVYSLVSCTSLTTGSQENPFKIKYLDEYVIYNDSIFEGSKIGGLSGIDYAPKQDVYYLACDDPTNPRFYKTSILIENNSFSKITIDTLVKLKDTTNQFLLSNTLDLESIRIFGENNLIFSSEGSIKKNQDPSIFITDNSGNYLDKYILPPNFLTDSSVTKNKPRHNKVLEGLALDHKGSGYWVAMEGTLALDGEMPTFTNLGSPIRITHFDTTTQQADDQFTYPLDKIAKDPKGKFGVNGITGLLQLNKNQFLCLERGYAAGYGSQGNTVRIYLADTKNSTNTLPFLSLKDQQPIVAKKKLLFDFESIRNQLTDHIVDNIEDITFGPTLPNGNQSLILVSDNNFNPTNIQINQFILLELIKTSTLE